MLGLINISVKNFIFDTYGEEMWNQVAEKLEKTEFLSDQQYGDRMTIDMFVAACEMLGTPVPTALNLFGKYFIGYVERIGYSNLLRLLGSSVLTFLSNLNNLHIHLSHAFPAMNPPEFTSEYIDENTIHVHYSSSREGLWPLAQGLIEGAAATYFGQEVVVNLINARVVNESVKSHMYTLEVVYPELNKFEQGVAKASEDSTFALEPEHFFKLFPFHLVLGPDLVIKQAGFAIERLLRSSLVGTHLTKHLKIVSPRVLAKDHVSLEELVENDETILILTTRATPENAAPLEMKGQISLVSEGNLLFLGFPVVRDYQDMLSHGLYLSDIPLHDGCRDMVLALEHHKAERGLKHKFEKLNMELKEATESLEREKERSESLLYQMLPQPVVSQLKTGSANTSAEHPSVSILFSDIVGFTRIGSSVEPSQVFAMLNELYTQFDAAIEDYPDLYKVETIGDAYMIVAGLEPSPHNHAERMVQFGIRMQKIARGVRNPATLEPLSIKVGVHSGPVVSGVVGIKMPRFCLFGDTVNTAARMESNSISGFVHVSKATYDMLDKTFFCMDNFIERSLEVKGKGMMTSYLLDCNEKKVPRASIDGVIPSSSEH